MANKKLLGLFSLVLACSLASAIGTVLSDDYFGSLEYSSNSTYSFYINDTSKTIDFWGANESNMHQSITIPHQGNQFMQRINHVWYHGWFDTRNLYLNEYIPLAIIYSETANLSNEAYLSNFIIPNLPVRDLEHVSLMVEINELNQSSKIESTTHEKLNSDSYLFSVFNESVSPHFYGDIAIEARLIDQGNGSKNIELHLWLKDDIAENEFNPHWTSPLTSIHGKFISLLSPSNAQSIETSGNEANIEFIFATNLSLITKEPFSCSLLIEGNNLTNPITYSNENLTTWYANSTLPLGNYNWSAHCQTSEKVYFSDISHFNIAQTQPETRIIPQEEGGRRRRVITPIENLDLRGSPNILDTSDNSPISLITGAVIGTLGKRGTLGIGLFILILGLALLIVYNREHLGLMKKKSK